MVPSESSEERLNFIKYQITELANLRVDNLCCLLATLYEVNPESARQAEAATNYRRILLQRLVELIIFTDVIEYN